MKGKCIAIFDNGGIILGEDNRRYNYTNTQVLNFNTLKREQRCKFTPNINKALEIVGANLKTSTKKECCPSIKNKPRRPKGSNIAFLGVLFQFLLLIPYIGYFFYVIGLSVTLVGIKKISKEKNIKVAYDLLLKGLYSGIIVIICILSLFFYFGNDIFNIRFETLHIGIIYYFFTLFALLFFNACYSSYLVYRGMNLLGEAYKCVLLRASAILHPFFLILLPFGIGVVIYYIYIIIMLVAFIRMRLWEQ